MLERVPLRVHERLGRAALIDAVNHPVTTIRERAAVSLNCSVCEGFTSLLLAELQTSGVESGMEVLAAAICDVIQPMCTTPSCVCCDERVGNKS